MGRLIDAVPELCAGSRTSFAAKLCSLLHVGKSTAGSETSDSFSPGRAPFLKPSSLFSGVYLSALMAYAMYYMAPSLFRAWFFSSDEYVYSAEVIRFLHLDFHQHFFDQPGTPFMFMIAIVWALFYWLQRGLFLIPSPTGLEQFTFNHLSMLFTAMRAATLLFFLGSVILLFRLASRLTNRAGACAASMILIMSPIYVSYSSFVRTESLSMCLLLAAILILLSSLEPADRAQPRAILILLAGMLAGVAAGARLHSITASLPTLLLLLWTTPGTAYPADDLRLRRFCQCTLACVFILGIAALLALRSNYFVHTAIGRAMHESLPHVLPVLQKWLITLLAATAATLGACYISTTRGLIIRVVNPGSLILLVGCAAGFLVATPTVVTQYEYLIRSAATYSGSYKDYERLGMPIVAHWLWFVKYYIQVIAPDKITLVLLVAGLVGVIFSRDRKLLVILATAALFFVSKPLDLAASPHHVILWLPFYAILSSYPIARAFGAVNRRWQHALIWNSVGLVLFLGFLWLGLTSGPRETYANFRVTGERMASIRLATEWIKHNTESDATVAVSYFCFNSDVFYVWLRTLEVPVPPYVFDGRQYLIWWGHGSALKGRKGYACVTKSDRHHMKTIMDLASPGEGTDPFQDPRFRIVKTFGTGTGEVDIFAFDFALDPQYGSVD